jgi:hypothetical protein
MLRDWPKVYRKVKKLRGMSLKEKVMFAQALAATPEERLQMQDQYLRSLNLYSYWERKKSGFRSSE